LTLGALTSQSTATITNVRYQPDEDSFAKTYNYESQDEIAQANSLRKEQADLSNAQFVSDMKHDHPKVGTHEESSEGGTYIPPQSAVYYNNDYMNNNAYLSYSPKTK